MGLLTIIKKQKAKDREIRVLMLGLDNAGKTTIVTTMLGGSISTVSPTMGFQIKTVTYNQHNLNIWDVGGQTTLRGFWGNYFDKTDVVIWVIDALSTERLEESFRELQEKVVQQDRLSGVCLAVVVNKIDLLSSELDIQNLLTNINGVLNLHDQISDRERWAIFPVSGKTGTGVKDVLDWVSAREYY
ncbi:GTP-binding protein Cin4p [[Candida] anglica]|uniref:GTP-binding protein Cin4p n=1 Tax=[Candida] anglica TaxID=148631 RepID=A0ABP0EIV5_9ASCO